MSLTLHPHIQERIYPAEQLQEFDFLLSADGTTLKPGLSGKATMLAIEQSFALGVPRAAQAAQLRLKANHADNLGKTGLSDGRQ